MQTEHYMSNMGKPRVSEPLGLVGSERVDDRADLGSRHLVTTLDPAPGSAQSLDDEAQPA
jgi:hypothetical protein